MTYLTWKELKADLVAAFNDDGEEVIVVNILKRKSNNWRKQNE